MSAGSLPDALHCEPERARPLAELVQDKTGGNPFFAMKFFTALADEGLLAFDSVAERGNGTSIASAPRAQHRQRGGSHGRKLKRLAVTTQQALKQLACLGNAAEAATLTMVHGGPEQAIARGTLEAVHAGSFPRG